MALINRYIIPCLAVLLILTIHGCRESAHVVYNAKPLMDDIEMRLVKNDNSQTNEIIDLQFVSTGMADGESVIVFLRNHLNVYDKELFVKDGSCSFSLDQSITSQSGLYQINVFYKGVSILEDHFYVNQDKAFGKLESFFGPKSLFVNDEDQSMLVVIPRDKFGNPVEQTVDYKAILNQDFSEVDSSITKNLVSYKNFDALESKGRKTLVANINEAAIREQELFIKAGVPDQIEISVLDYYPFADSRQHIHLVSETILDALGNTVEDGTIIHFTMKDLETKSLFAHYSSMTINGVATVFIKNPSTSKSVLISANHYSSCESNAIELNFDAYITDFDLSTNNSKIYTSPILAKTGQLITDGTIGIAEILSSGEKFETESLNGVLTFDIDPNYFEKSSDSLIVTIGGISKSIQVDYGEGI